jgi:hypothetical protein
MNTLSHPFRNSLILIGLLLIFSSCSEQILEDLEAPVITLSSPSQGASYPAGQDVMIEAIVEENQDLHTYRILVEDANGNTALTIDRHEHGRSVQVLDSFDAQVPGQYQIRFFATDHNANTGSETRSFTVTL